jgi:hypothetical protein
MSVTSTPCIGISLYAVPARNGASATAGLDLDPSVAAGAGLAATNLAHPSQWVGLTVESCRGHRFFEHW